MFNWLFKSKKNTDIEVNPEVLPPKQTRMFRRFELKEKVQQRKAVFEVTSDIQVNGTNKVFYKTIITTGTSEDIYQESKLEHWRREKSITGFKYTKNNTDWSNSRILLFSQPAEPIGTKYIPRVRYEAYEVEKPYYDSDHHCNGMTMDCGTVIYTTLSHNKISDEIIEDKEITGYGLEVVEYRDNV